MNFYHHKKNRNSKSVAKKTSQKKSGSFEKAFTERLGKNPVDFICMKLAVGSDKNAVSYLYAIIAAEIARENNCNPIPFENLYETAHRKASEQKEQNRLLAHEQDFCKKMKLCQQEYLNNVDGRPFGGLCAGQMDLLYGDNEICSKIIQIGKEYSNIEFCDNTAASDFLKFKREILPKRMKELGITESPVVKSICDYVIKSGKSEKSALITIYYAVRSYTLKMSIK